MTAREIRVSPVAVQSYGEPFVGLSDRPVSVTTIVTLRSSFLALSEGYWRLYGGLARSPQATALLPRDPLRLRQRVEMLAIGWIEDDLCVPFRDEHCTQQAAIR